METPAGEVLYVGRTGDNSSPHATAPYTRMGQHLGAIKTQNALRKHLEKRGVELAACTFHLVSHGPLYPEVEKSEGAQRAALMAAHFPVRNIVGAMEKALADDLSAAGYDVLNTVKWKPPPRPGSVGSSAGSVRRGVSAPFRMIGKGRPQPPVFQSSAVRVGYRCNPGN